VPDIEARTFTGTESVALRFRSATATIVFNTLNLTLHEVRVDGKPVKDVATDNDAQLTTVTAPSALAAGLHTLTVSYSGHIESQPQGLFVQPYTKSAGGEGLMLSTQMESTDARRMFPCWDEPALRATLQLTATVPTEWSTVGNMQNTRKFGSLPDGDRIALLDDQWALVHSGDASLQSYLALAGAMGSDLDTRAWEQIVDALGTIEYDERGSQGHEAFTVYARSIVKPVTDRLGWDAKPGETSNTQQLRGTLIADLGTWGDPQILAEARRRFSRFVGDRSAISPDDQVMILSIVGLYADEATFEQLHTLAKQAQDAAERRRFYMALATVRDATLAQQAAQIALEREIPAQAVVLRLEMVFALRNEHPDLAWSVLSANAQTLFSSLGHLEPLFMAQYVPRYRWNSLPLE
jgi:aminopeptidase N